MWDFISGLFDTATGAATGGVSTGVQLAGGIWTRLTDYRMWRSIGWLVLGVMLAGWGFLLWNRKAIASGVASAAKLAAVAA